MSVTDAMFEDVAPPRAPVYWQAHGRGPALVLINGYAASARTWPREWLRELEQRFRVITLDNRGSGFSRFVDTPFSIADLADDVAQGDGRDRVASRRRSSASRWAG